MKYIMFGFFIVLFSLSSFAQRPIGLYKGHYRPVKMILKADGKRKVYTADDMLLRELQITIQNNAFIFIVEDHADATLIGKTWHQLATMSRIGHGQYGTRTGFLPLVPLYLGEWDTQITKVKKNKVVFRDVDRDYFFVRIDYDKTVQKMRFNKKGQLVIKRKFKYVEGKEDGKLKIILERL
jgi:hypothetical protein